MTPLGTKSVYKEKYLSQAGHLSLREHLAGPILCLKGCSHIYVTVTKFKEQANLEITGLN
jgi:hypothetical protein